MAHDTLDIATIGHNGGPPVETWASALGRLDDETLLQRDQLAAILGISARTLTRMAFDPGGIPSLKFGKRRLFRVGSFKEWLRRREERPGRRRAA